MTSPVKPEDREPLGTIARAYSDGFGAGVKFMKPDRRQVEDQMVPRLVTAIYPVLLPLEQQDMHECVTQIAKIVWRFFIESDERNRRMVLDALGGHDEAGK